MEAALLKEIINKLDRLDEKVTNFMGFFDLAPKEKIGLKKDIVAYKRKKLDVISVGEAEGLV